jgi:hypothetical protein
MARAFPPTQFPAKGVVHPVPRCGAQGGDVLDHAVGGASTIHGDQQVSVVPSRDLPDRLVSYLEVICRGGGSGAALAGRQRQRLAGVVAPGAQRVMTKRACGCRWPAPYRNARSPARRPSGSRWWDPHRDQPRVMMGSPRVAVRSATTHAFGSPRAPGRSRAAGSPRSPPGCARASDPRPPARTPHPGRPAWPHPRAPEGHRQSAPRCRPAPDPDHAPAQTPDGPTPAVNPAVSPLRSAMIPSAAAPA